MRVDERLPWLRMPIQWSGRRRSAGGAAMGMLKAVSKSAKAAFDEVHGYGRAGNDAV